MKKPISAEKTPQEPELCPLYHSWLTPALPFWLKPLGFGRCLRTKMLMWSPVLGRVRHRSIPGSCLFLLYFFFSCSSVQEIGCRQRRKIYRRMKLILSLLWDITPDQSKIYLDPRQEFSREDFTVTVQWGSEKKASKYHSGNQIPEASCRAEPRIHPDLCCSLFRQMPAGTGSQAFLGVYAYE